MKNFAAKYLPLLASLLLATQCIADEFKVGTTLSLSGAYATYGRHALHGVELAVEEINKKGGVKGQQVKLIVEDVGTYDLKQAATSARKLITTDKVQLFLPMIVEDSEVIVPLTTKASLFTMVVGCGARKCGKSLGPYNVRAPASHDLIIDTLFKYAQDKKVQHSCIIAAEATYFEGYGRYIEELTKKAGQRVTYVSVPLSNESDHREIATRFKQEGCDAIYTWIPLGSVGPFFRRIRESGSKAQILSIVETDDPAVLQSAGPAAEGVVFAHFLPGSPEFQKRYLERFKEPLLRPAVPAYDGVKLLLTLADKVGTDPQSLRDAITKVKNAPAENGTITFTDEGERLGEKVELMQISGGKAIPVVP